MFATVQPDAGYSRHVSNVLNARAEALWSIPGIERLKLGVTGKKKISLVMFFFAIQRAAIWTIAFLRRACEKSSALGQAVRIHNFL